MIWAKLVFGGLGRRGLEAVVALAVLAVAVAIMVGALMVIEGARDALARAAHEDRPDIVQVKSRFNRALFESPRSGYLPPLTIPVYEPLIDPAELRSAGGVVIARQSFLRNIVTGDSFLNLYIFGIEPEKETQASTFSVTKGRFLRPGDGAVAVLDQVSARDLGVEIGGSFPVRKADGRDLELTVVGILDRLGLRDAPPRTVDAPALVANSNQVSSGVFVTLRTSEEIFSRSTLTDALVIAPKPEDVPSVVERLRDGSGIEFFFNRYADHQEILEAIGRTSVESLQRRFFVPKLHFSDKELDFFINVDFKDHVALVAELDENGRRVIVGGGRYIMVQPAQAEMAFTVIDAYQGKGIGSVLMGHLIAIARDGGLKELIAEVLPENAPMLKLFSRFGFRTVASEDLQVKHLALQLA